MYSDHTISKINNEIKNIISKYQEHPVTELFDIYNISPSAKNRLNLLMRRLIEYENFSYLTQDISGSDLNLKTIKLDKYGRLKESMSFPAFQYCDIVKETWECSSLRQIFYEKKFVFAVFQNKGKELYIDRMFVWEMPKQILEESVSCVWKQTQACLLAGNIVKYIDTNGRYFTYFPSSSENPHVHVRPHAQNKEDTFPLPVPDSLTGMTKYPKHSFWLNRSYISKILSSPIGK